jgi:peroxiredoxin
MKKIISLFAVLCLLVGCVVDEPDEGNSSTDVVEVGDRLPFFSVDVVGGSDRYTFSSDALTGSTVIVFFNTSCSDCQRELPELNDYYLRHRQELGFRMVAIAREESEESIATYWKQHNLSIPYSPQTDRRVYNLFATQYIPRAYICSAQGVILWMGIENFDMPD